MKPIRLMQAVVLKHGVMSLNSMQTPMPAVGEALIRLRLAGICATDLELQQGYAGFQGVPGHEFVGEVVAVADNRHQDWLGQRVVGEINLACGDCEYCRQGLSKHCLQRQVLGIRQKAGVFAEYFTLPVANLYRVPDGLRDEQAVFAEPLAAALAVTEPLPAPAHCSPIAVLGPGRLGLLIALSLQQAGYAVVVLGRSQASLVLPQRLGLAVGETGLQPAQSWSWVVDATGCAEGLRQALRMLKPQGSLILKSTYAHAEPVDFQAVVVAELRIVGSRCGCIAEALTLLTRDVLPLEALVDYVYPLIEAELAFQHAAQPGVRKILLRPD